MGIVCMKHTGAISHAMIHSFIQPYLCLHTVEMPKSLQKEQLFDVASSLKSTQMAAQSIVFLPSVPELLVT